MDPYPGPDAVWRFLERNQTTLIVLVCGVLVLVAVPLFAKFWRGGGCAGTESDRALVEALARDPLMTTLPPGATTAQESITYLCPGRRVRTTRIPPRPTVSAAVEIIKQARLAEPMEPAALHQYLAWSVGLGQWRLIATGQDRLSYCRESGPYRVVSVMILDDQALTNHIRAWTDGADCAAEVSPPS